MIATMNAEIADLEYEIALRRRGKVRWYRGWSISQMLEEIAALKRRIEILEDAEHQRVRLQQDEETSIAGLGF